MNAIFYAIAAVIVLAIAIAHSISTQREQIDRQDIQDVAGNTSVYLSAVKAYVRSNPSYVGDVQDSALGLPSWYVKLSGIRCYASAGRGFLYLTDVSERQGIEVADQMALKYASGRNQSGQVISGSGEAFNVPGQVPNGSYVIYF